MNDSIRSALVNVIKANRKKISRAQRKKGVKPQRWLYPHATEARYATTIRAWIRPMKDYVHSYLKENQAAILRGDSSDDVKLHLDGVESENISVTRLDAVPGKSFKTMIDSANGWLGQYVPTDNEAVSGSPIYMGLGKIADSVFDFNEGQYEKGAKSVLGVAFPVGEDWWPDARELWAYNNYQAISGDMYKYVHDINGLVEKAVTSGLSVKALSEQITALDEKLLKSRANFIARDQIGKLNGQITQMRMESIGLSMYVWDTSNDERVRPSHQLIDEGLCRWDDSTVFSQDGGKTWIDRPAGAVRLHPGMDYLCRCVAISYWQELVGEADEMIAQYEELDAISAQNIATMPKPKPLIKSPVPLTQQSKKYVTQKALQAEVTELDKQMKVIDLNTATEADQKRYQDLKVKKEAIEAEIQGRKLKAEKKKIIKQIKILEKELLDFEIKTYSGIWKDDVTVKDYEAKISSISMKKAYYESELKRPNLSAAEKAKYNLFLQDLRDFEVEGKKYTELIASIDEKQNLLTSLRKGAILKKNSPYSQSRKNKALWAQTPETADNKLRSVSGEVWQQATVSERESIYQYTQNSGSFNRPLRGYDKNWSSFKGLGKVPLDNEGRGNAIANMTKLIDHSKYDFDVWLQRGVETADGAAAFLGISESELRHWSQTELQQLIDKEITDQAFVSCGSAKGKGFSGYIFNIYCPMGTKMMYAEPFSHYGKGGGLHWDTMHVDGFSKQSNFGYEDETIIQRGTKFKITKVEKKGIQIFFDLEVVEQL